MVSVARRNLFQEKTRLIISIGGVAFALLLMLAFDGLIAGMLSQITAYIDNTQADVYVSQPGVRNMHMANSALPLAKAAEIRGVDGVVDVDPILYTTNYIIAGDNRAAAYVIGFNPAEGRGGPWRLSSGSADLESGQAVLDASIAAKLGVGLGDETLIMGVPFRVRGLSRGTANIAGSVAFVRLDDFAKVQLQPGTASYLLVRLASGVSPKEGAQRISAAVRDVEAMTRAEFAGEEARVVRDMSAEVMLIMNAIAFLIGLAAAGLTIYTATLGKMREYGVLKALGAGNRWLYRLVVGQAFWSVALGAGVAVAMAFALSGLLAMFLPNTPLRIKPESVLKVIVAAGLISIISAGVPVRQMARLDPAAVFRR